MFRLVCAIVFSFATFAATAQEIAGARDPAYRLAVSDWLSGEDDLAALTQFGALARDGNLAAQLTLGMIEFDSFLHYHVTQGLEREARNALLRAPRGRFGRNWLQLAAEQSELADLLLMTGVKDGGSWSEHSAALAEAGAIRRAFEVAESALSQQSFWDGLRALSHPALMPLTRGFVHMTLVEQISVGATFDSLPPEAVALYRDVLQSDGAATRMDTMLWLGLFGAIRTDDLPFARDPLQLHGAALMVHPQMAPLADIIRDLCPEDPAYVMGLLRQSGQPLPLHIALLSPLEPLITSAEWTASPRFRADMLRWIRTDLGRSAVLKRHASCLARAANAAKPITALDPTSR